MVSMLAQCSYKRSSVFACLLLATKEHLLAERKHSFSGPTRVAPGRDTWEVNCVTINTDRNMFQGSLWVNNGHVKENS